MEPGVGRFTGKGRHELVVARNFQATQAQQDFRVPMPCREEWKGGHRRVGLGRVDEKKPQGSTGGGPIPISCRSEIKWTADELERFLKVPFLWKGGKKKYGGQERKKRETRTTPKALGLGGGKAG